MLCPATKFPEAIPLKEPSSTEIVGTLLSSHKSHSWQKFRLLKGQLSRTHWPLHFLDRCGIKVIHSSLYHPQSNSIEKWHPVLKRVLRALCYEHKEDWESCLGYIVRFKNNSSRGHRVLASRTSIKQDTPFSSQDVERNVGGERREPDRGRVHAELTRST